MTEPIPDNVVEDPRFDPTHVYVTPVRNVLAYDLLTLGPPTPDDVLLNIESYADHPETFNIVFLQERFRLSPAGKIHPVVVRVEDYAVDEI